MKGPIPYIGGKSVIANKIIALFPPHKLYSELFGGGGQILFHKPHSPVEVYNDLDGDIVNVFRVIQHHYEELIRYMRFMIVSRQWFDLLRSTEPETLTDIQKAARRLYLQKTSYAGRVDRQNFRTGKTQPPSFNPERLPELIEEAHHRLARVQIECLPYEKVLAKYDSRSALHYADPPYWGPKLYHHNMEPNQFRAMADRLAGIQGKFILSLNDVPPVRETFKGFRFRSIELPYTAQKVAGKRFKEVLITNF